jgi:hypothetical protein
MPDARGRYFMIDQRQPRYWLYDDVDERGTHARPDALPLPVEPQRERSTRGNRLAFVLRTIIRPSAG